MVTSPLLVRLVLREVAQAFQSAIAGRLAIFQWVDRDRAAMREGQDQGFEKLYGALGSPHRRQILEILRTKPAAGFKELHDTLEISVGALYHHLDALTGLVDQGKDKKYFLTERGRSALETLRAGEEKIVAQAAGPSGRETAVGVTLKEVLFGWRIFRYVSREPWKGLPIALAVVVAGGWLSMQTRLEPLLLFYFNTARGLDPAWFLLLFPLGWIATFALCEAFAVGIFHRRGGELSLLTGTAFAMLPLLIVPAVLYAARVFMSGSQPSAYSIAVLPVILQPWVICLLSGSVSMSKGLGVERTALVSLGVMYANIMVIVLALQFGIF